ncbi:MAG: hypothetical protein HZA77_11545 [Candidatus Schekmanbacteria bacterium]|nr:hypothetical protein [Candidatus Schekmanbacteria bacterium]
MLKKTTYIFCCILIAEFAFFLWSNYRLTSTLNLPTDDGYIYLNYIKNAAEGHFFEYNIGEKSGGVTGFLWYVVLTPVFFISRFFFSDIYKALLFANYFSGLVLLVLSLIVLLRLSYYLSESEYVPVVCGILFIVNSKLIWGALSGMEVPLTAFMILISLNYFFKDYDKGKFKWSLLLLGLCGWTREELYILPSLAVIFLFLEHFGIVSRIFGIDIDNKRISLRDLIKSIIIPAPIAVIPLFLYWYFTGLLFPTPFYIYVPEGYNINNLWAGYLAMADQLDLYHIFLYLFALIGLVFIIAKKIRLLDNLFSATFVFTFFTWKALKSIYLGTVFRYVTPYDPLISIAASIGLFALGESIYRNVTMDIRYRNKSNYIKAALIIPFSFVICYFSFITFDFAQKEYPTHVQNINDAVVSVAEWISVNCPGNAVVAAVPIGGIKLYSNRTTIDIDGLTTHYMMGRSPGNKSDFRYWINLLEYMKRRRSDYIVYFRSSFINEAPFPFFKLLHSFPIPNNIIVPSSPVDVYMVDWAYYNKIMSNIMERTAN